MYDVTDPAPDSFWTTAGPSTRLGRPLRPPSSAAVNPQENVSAQSATISAETAVAGRGRGCLRMRTYIVSVKYAAAATGTQATSSSVQGDCSKLAPPRQSI